MSYITRTDNVIAIELGALVSTNAVYRKKVKIVLIETKAIIREITNREIFLTYQEKSNHIR